MSHALRRSRMVAASARRRALVDDMLRLCGVGLGAAGVLSAILVMLAKLRWLPGAGWSSWSRGWVLLAGPVAIGLAAGAVTAWARRWSLGRAAREVDERLGLKSALTSGLEFEGRPSATAFERLAMEESERAAGRVDASRAVSVRVRRGWAWGAVALAAVGLGLEYVPTRAMSRREAREQRAALEREEVKSDLSRAMDAVRRVEAPVADAASGREMRALQEIEKALAKEELTSGEARARAAGVMADAAEAMEREVEERRASMESAKRAASRAASRPVSGSVSRGDAGDGGGETAPLRESMVRGDAEGAAEAVEQIAERAPSLSREERERLAREFEELAESLGEATREGQEPARPAGGETGTTEALSRALRDAAEALRPGEPAPRPERRESTPEKKESAGGESKVERPGVTPTKPNVPRGAEDRSSGADPVGVKPDEPKSDGTKPEAGKGERSPEAGRPSGTRSEEKAGGEPKESGTQEKESSGSATKPSGASTSGDNKSAEHKPADNTGGERRSSANESEGTKDSGAAGATSAERGTRGQEVNAKPDAKKGTEPGGNAEPGGGERRKGAGQAERPGGDKPSEKPGETPRGSEPRASGAGQKPLDTGSPGHAGEKKQGEDGAQRDATEKKQAGSREGSPGKPENIGQGERTGGGAPTPDAGQSGEKRDGIETGEKAREKPGQKSGEKPGRETLGEGADPDRGPRSGGAEGVKPERASGGEPKDDENGARLAEKPAEGVEKEAKRPGAGEMPKELPGHLSEKLPDELPGKLPDKLPSGEALEKLAERFRDLHKMAEGTRLTREQAENMRRRAQEMLEKASPEERRRLRELAEKLGGMTDGKHEGSAGEMARDPGKESGEHPGGELGGSFAGEGSAKPAARKAGPISMGTKAMDARGAGAPGASREERTIAEWYRDRGAGERSVSRESISEGFREAAEGVERAIEQQDVPTERSDFVRRVFKRYVDRATAKPAKSEGGVREAEDAGPKK